MYIIPRCHRCHRRERDVGEVRESDDFVDGKLTMRCCIGFAKDRVATNADHLFCKLLCEKCWAREIVDGCLNVRIWD